MPKMYLDTGHKTEKVKYDSVQISGKFIQVYDDLYKVLKNIQSPCALHLLFWMSDHMGKYNQIGMNKSQRALFISESISSKKYSDSTVKSALLLLTKHELITSMNRSGKRESLYFVNPFYFWKTGSQKDRTESIKGFLYKLQENEGN